MKKIIVTAILAFILLFICFSQNTTNNAGMQSLPDRIRTGNEGFASDEFRRGVQSYNKGAFSEAIVQFEKALSYLPNDNLILDWLGKAYYKIGLEGEALNYWQNVVNNGYGGLLLQNKIEIVRERRVTGEINDNFLRLSESGSFPGVFTGQLIYNGPVSVQPEYDGTMWIVAYNSNEIIMLNHNRNYDTKIENIRRNYVNEYGDEDFSMLEHNECRVFVGNKIVQYTKYPDIYTTDLSVEIPQSISDYYMSIVPITEQILNIWHDKIVEIQDENNKKLENYKLDGYDELIFAYYSINSDDRAFQYLKKLATRYPNSNYNNRLRRVENIL